MIKGFEVTCQIVWLSSLSSASSASTSSFSLLIKRQHHTTLTIEAKKGCFLSKKAYVLISKGCCCWGISFVTLCCFHSTSLEWFPGNFKQMDGSYYKERFLCWNKIIRAFFVLSCCHLSFKSPWKESKQNTVSPAACFHWSYESMTHFPTDLIFMAWERSKNARNLLAAIFLEKKSREEPLPSPSLSPYVCLLPWRLQVIRNRYFW